MSRASETYRAARRNAALRGDPREPWSPRHYFQKHDAEYRRLTVLSRKPSRYHPLAAVGAYLRSIGKAWGRKGETSPEQAAFGV